MARRKHKETEPALYAVIKLMVYVFALPFVLIAYLFKKN